MLYDQRVKKVYERFYKPKEGDTIIDAGAHQGTFAVSMASAVKNGRVIAIEPIKANLTFLEKNLKINNLKKNVKVIPKGLWSSPKRITFYLSTSSALHSAFVKTSKSVEIEVDTLDNIIKEQGVKKVDFIKMNVEGAEIEALKGARKTLMANPVELVIDAHHIINGRPTYKTVIPMLQELGFTYIGKSLIYSFPKR